MNIVRHLVHVAQGKHPITAVRSGKWSTLRKNFLKQNTKCAVCGGTYRLEVHHKQPFHINPELELDPNNLIVLCEAKKNGINCHLAFGHLGNFKSLNPSVESDSEIWNKKLKDRNEYLA
jgi:5-methylcytosine-specific restriction endonuclease McrA